MPEAVTIAETVAAMRHDIFTEDALAWAYYKVGRLEDAYAASQRALRTGTHDEAMLAQAAQIRAAARRDVARGSSRDRLDPSRHQEGPAFELAYDDEASRFRF